VTRLDSNPTTLNFNGVGTYNLCLKGRTVCKAYSLGTCKHAVEQSWGLLYSAVAIYSCLVFTVTDPITKKLE
jgi:hypothetical protein